MWDASPNGSLVQQPLAQVSSEARIPNNTIQYLSSTSSRDSWVFLDSIDPQSLRFSIKSKTSKNSSDSKSLKKMAHQILKINDIPIENPQRIEKLFSVSQLIIESASKNHEKTISWIHDQKREIRKLQKEILQFKNNIPEVIGVKCPICLKSFESMEYLDLHIYLRHQNYVDMWNSLRVPQNIQYSPDQNSISSIEGQNKKHGKKKRHLENMSVSENYSNISNYSSSNYVNRNNESKNYVNEYDPQAVPLILNEFKAEIEKTQKQTEQKMMNLLSQQISNFEMKIDEKMSTLRGDSLVDTIPSISTITTSKMINSDVTPTSSVIPNSKLIYNSSTQNSSINHNSNDVPSSSIFQKSNIVNSDILQNSDIPKNSRNNESSIFDLPTFSEDESSQLIEDSFEINKRRNNKGKDLSHLKTINSVDSLNSIESINSINLSNSFNNNYSSNMSNSLSNSKDSLSNYGKNKKGRKQLKKSDNSFFEFSPNPSSLEETSNSYKSYSNDDTPVLAWQKKDFGDQLDLIPYVTNTTNTASNLEINSIPEKSDKTIENQNINQQKPKLEMMLQQTTEFVNENNFNNKNTLDKEESNSSNDKGIEINIGYLNAKNYSSNPKSLQASGFLTDFHWTNNEEKSINKKISLEIKPNIIVNQFQKPEKETQKPPEKSSLMFSKSSVLIDAPLMNYSPSQNVSKSPKINSLDSESSSLSSSSPIFKNNKNDLNLNQPIILTNKKTQVKVKSQSNEILITEDNDEENAKDYEIFHSPIRKSSEKKPKSFNKSYLSKPRNTNHDSDFSFSMSSSAQGETPEEIAERARWKIKKLFTFDSDNSDNIELDRKLSKTDNVDRHRRNTRKLSVDTSTRKRGSSQIDVDPDDKMNNTSISRRKRKNENSNKRSSRKHTKSRRHSTHNHRDFSENSIDKNDYTSEYDNDFEDELERVYSKSRHIDDIPVNKASINDIQKSDNRNTGGRPKLQISSNLQDDEPRNKGKEKPLKLAISGDLVKLDEIKEKIKPKLKICNYIVAADQPFTLSESSEFLSPAYIAPTMEPYKPSHNKTKTRTTPHNEISSKTSHQTEKLYETPKIKNESNLELFSSEPTLSEGSSDQTSNVPKHKSSQNKEFRYLSESSSSSAAVDQIIYSSDTYRRRRAASTKRKKRKADKLAETANPVSPSSFFTPIQDNNAENPHDNKKHQENRKKFGDVVSKARDKLNKTVKVTPKSKNERKYRKMFKPMNDLLSDSSVEKQIRRRREKQKKLFNEKPEKNSIIINEKETAQTKDKVKGNIQEKNDSKNVEPHSPLRSTIHQRSSRPNKTTPPKLNLPDSDNRILKEFNKSFELENKQPPSPIERIGDIDVSSSSIMDIPGDSPRGIRKKALFDTDESIENIFNSDSNLQSPTKTTKKPNNRGNTPCKTPQDVSKNAGQAPNNETRKDISPTKPIEMPIKRRPTPKSPKSPVNGNLETEITQKELTLQDNQRKELRIQSSDIKENNEDKIDFDENKNEIIDKSSLHKSPPRTNLINSSPMLRKHTQIDLHSEEEMSSNLSEKPNTQPCSPISQIVPESSKTVLTSQIKASTPPISPTQLLKGNMNRPQSKFTSQKMRIQTLNHRRNQKKENENNLNKIILLSDDEEEEKTPENISEIKIRKNIYNHEMHLNNHENKEMIIEEKESSFNISDGILLEDDLEEPQIQQPTKIYTSVSSNSQQKENLEEEEKISIEKANENSNNNSFSFNSNDISDITDDINQTKQESEKEKNENNYNKQISTDKHPTIKTVNSTNILEKLESNNFDMFNLTSINGEEDFNDNNNISVPIANENDMSEEVFTNNENKDMTFNDSSNLLMLAEVSDNSNEESSIKVSDTFLIGEQDETLHNEQEQTLEPKIVRKSEPKLESEQSRHQTEQKPVSENEYEFEIKSTAEQESNKNTSLELNESELEEQNDLERKELEQKELERKELERKELERKELERKELERKELERKELERKELERKELERKKLERKELERKELERKELERKELERKELERKELERKELERKELERKELERKELERKELERKELERKKLERKELERKELERKELERKELERKELERKELERKELERKELERKELERKELERKELERKELERKELERKELERKELERKELERKELERKELERKELERKELERKELERKELERKELERKELERKELERKELERKELERKELERKELERKELERKELERKELERKELERKELERNELEQKELERKELERKELERKELERKELEQKELERKELERKELEQKEIKKCQQKSESENGQIAPNQIIDESNFTNSDFDSDEIFECKTTPNETMTFTNSISDIPEVNDEMLPNITNAEKSSDFTNGVTKPEPKKAIQLSSDEDDLQPIDDDSLDHIEIAQHNSSSSDQYDSYSSHEIPADEIPEEEVDKGPIKAENAIKKEMLPESNYAEDSYNEEDDEEFLFEGNVTEKEMKELTQTENDNVKHPIESSDAFSDSTSIEDIDSSIEFETFEDGIPTEKQTKPQDPIISLETSTKIDPVVIENPSIMSNDNILLENPSLEKITTSNSNHQSSEKYKNNKSKNETSTSQIPSTIDDLEIISDVEKFIGSSKNPILSPQVSSDEGSIDNQDFSNGIEEEEEEEEFMVLVRSKSEDQILLQNNRIGQNINMSDSYFNLNNQNIPFSDTIQPPRYDIVMANRQNELEDELKQKELKIFKKQKSEENDDSVDKYVQVLPKNNHLQDVKPFTKPSNSQNQHLPKKAIKSSDSQSEFPSFPKPNQLYAISDTKIRGSQSLKDILPLTKQSEQPNEASIQCSRSMNVEGTSPQFIPKSSNLIQFINDQDALNKNQNNSNLQQQNQNDFSKDKIENANTDMRIVHSNMKGNNWNNHNIESLNSRYSQQSNQMNVLPLAQPTQFPLDQKQLKPQQNTPYQNRIYSPASSEFSKMNSISSSMSMRDEEELSVGDYDDYNHGAFQNSHLMHGINNFESLDSKSIDYDQIVQVEEFDENDEDGDEENNLSLMASRKGNLPLSAVGRNFNFNQNNSNFQEDNFPNDFQNNNTQYNQNIKGNLNNGMFKGNQMKNPNSLSSNNLGMQNNFQQQQEENFGGPNNSLRALGGQNRPPGGFNQPLLAPMNKLERQNNNFGGNSLPFGNQNMPFNQGVNNNVNFNNNNNILPSNSGNFNNNSGSFNNSNSNLNGGLNNKGSNKVVPGFGSATLAPLDQPKQINPSNFSFNQGLFNNNLNDLNDSGAIHLKTGINNPNLAFNAANKTKINNPGSRIGSILNSKSNDQFPKSSLVVEEDEPLNMNEGNQFSNEDFNSNPLLSGTSSFNHSNLQNNIHSNNNLGRGINSNFNSNSNLSMNNNLGHNGHLGTNNFEMSDDMSSFNSIQSVNSGYGNISGMKSTGRIPPSQPIDPKQLQQITKQLSAEKGIGLSSPLSRSAEIETGSPYTISPQGSGQILKSQSISQEHQLTKQSSGRIPRAQPIDPAQFQEITSRFSKEKFESDQQNASNSNSFPNSFNNSNNINNHCNTTIGNPQKSLGKIPRAQNIDQNQFLEITRRLSEDEGIPTNPSKGILRSTPIDPKQMQEITNQLNNGHISKQVSNNEFRNQNGEIPRSTPMNINFNHQEGMNLSPTGNNQIPSSNSSHFTKEIFTSSRNLPMVEDISPSNPESHDNSRKLRRSKPLGSVIAESPLSFDEADEIQDHISTTQGNVSGGIPFVSQAFQNSNSNQQPGRTTIMAASHSGNLNSENRIGLSEAKNEPSLGSDKFNSSNGFFNNSFNNSNSSIKNINNSQNQLNTGFNNKNNFNSFNNGNGFNNGNNFDDGNNFGGGIPKMRFNASNGDIEQPNRGQSSGSGFSVVHANGISPNKMIPQQNQIPSNLGNNFEFPKFQQQQQKQPSRSGFSVSYGTQRPR